MEPSPPVHLDPATAAGEVSLRFDRWFAEHQLQLPPETRAQFVQMGVEALERWPDRSTGDVLDELISELDQRLFAIAEEQTRAGRDDREPRRGASGFGRFFRRRERPH